MADTVRERIAQAAKAALEAPGAPAPTYRRRIDALPQSKLPAFCIVLQPEKKTDGEGDNIERTMMMAVICAVGNSSMDEEASIDQLSEPLTSWAEMQLVGNQFGGLATDVTYDSTEWMNVAGEIDLLGATVTFEVKYWTISGDPSQSAN
jgi:hypothetical protein